MLAGTGNYFAGWTRSGQCSGTSREPEARRGTGLCENERDYDQSLSGGRSKHLRSGPGLARGLEVMSWSSVFSTHCMGYCDF